MIEGSGARRLASAFVWSEHAKDDVRRLPLRARAFSRHGGPLARHRMQLLDLHQEGLFAFDRAAGAVRASERRGRADHLSVQHRHGASTHSARPAAFIPSMCRAPIPTRSTSTSAASTASISQRSSRTLFDGTELGAHRWPGGCRGDKRQVAKPAIGVHSAVDGIQSAMKTTTEKAAEALDLLARRDAGDCGRISARTGRKISGAQGAG